MKKALCIIFVSSFVLCGCSPQNDSSNHENKQRHTDEQSTIKNQNNFSNQTSATQISPQDAEKILHDYYINVKGLSEGQILEFKTNLNRSNENEYYIEHLVRDAAGTPMKVCGVVNKHTGDVINIFDDMSPEEKANYEDFKKRSPKYITPQDETTLQESNPNSNQPTIQQEPLNKARQQAINEGIDMDNPSEEDIQRMRELSKQSPYGMQEPTQFMGINE
ncbi:MULTISPECIES: hypothetical protein [unclassified Staphylococcus]|uniref:hypothetical protein n=1 Tax=unclassified Staphylococcus TaxID=91994 RepID=UPI0021D0A5BB|nr:MULTISPECIES: hypothetical protein [unclassified Staphylococcus]UXR70030.1 hypothetical protein MUA26_02480 [Staphylococcus sp. IVB6246]UXR72088.1 hypothetical protein MUA88_02555 [Staphylococcus sp. IVB6240]UXR74396.1 hypothetical protein MUA48_02730 [Staphylococcus sp. IVB6238]UXR76781.1 hypothetical protein MUA74_03090 [Staphylococcus sp. IVB6233]UXR80909.1 hypothetical protein MUA65_02700 [Staphylococcus sp. IVB6218]